MMFDAPLPSTDYDTWLHTLTAPIQSALISAARAANRESILLYWCIGYGIAEKQQALGLGKSEAERLSANLKAKFSGIRCFPRREPLAPTATLE